MIGRATKLERLGLAEQVAPGCWALKPGIEGTLRDLSVRGDIIKTMNRAITSAGREPDLTGFALQGDQPADPVQGRLVARGLHDELRGTAYAVIDGVDGRPPRSRRYWAFRSRWRNWPILIGCSSLPERETRRCALFGRFVRGGPDVKPTLSRAQNSENVDLKLADFFGLQNLSARALLSESYRNAVAAAIFLAAATKHSGVPRFMVLDDVTSSFDAGHQFALMDAMRTLLRYGAVPDGLQFIILSHDTSLEKYFDKLNGTSDWHHQKLQGMPPKGRLMVSAQESDRLKAQALQHLNAGQIDIGAPFLRQYLEYKLGQIIAKLEVPVPPDYATRGDKRTLSTYIDAISEAVKLYQAANRCILAPQQIIDLQNHHAPSIIGNFVSHYETGAGTPFNAYALLGVLQSIDALADCFSYVDPTNNQKRFYRRLDRR
jgi:hypothetical protein